MEYRYRYTWWERVCFVGKLTVESIVKTKSFMVIFGVCFAIGIIEQVVNTTNRQGMDLLGSIALAFFPAIFFILPASVVRYVLLFAEFSPRGFREDRLAGVRGGCFFSGMSTGKCWYPCNRLQTIHVVGPLMWFGWKRSARDIMYIIIPTRLFASKEERKEFLEYVERQRRQEPTEIDTLWKGMADQADWEASFKMDESLWISMQTEALEIKKILHMRQAPVYRISQEEIHRRVKKELIPDLIYGTWNVKGTKQGIYYQTPSFCEFMDWSGIRTLTETDRFFNIYGQRDDWMFGLERTNKIDLAEICLKHKIVHRVVSLTPPDQRKRAMTKGQRRCLVIGITVVVFLAISMVQKMRSIINDLEGEIGVYAESETVYTFYPENFAEYQPLETQIEVLQSLGLQVSDEAVDSLQGWMERWPEAREWVEGQPYTSLLTELGYPQYNEETWEVTSFSNQIYWFDLEGYDVGEDYAEILNGIQALSGGEFAISDVVSDTEYVDWETGKGFVRVQFLLNGKPCEYKAKVEWDWLDGGIVSYVGRQLKKEHTLGKLYSMDDDGQGLILFFRDQKWADQFRERTGKALFEEPVG